MLDESYDPATASRQPRMEVDFYPKHVLANVCDIDFLQIDVVKDNLILLEFPGKLFIRDTSYLSLISKYNLMF